MKGDRLEVAFDLAEINLSTIAALDAGAVNIETVAGTIVNNATQLVVAGQWLFEQFIPITHQNGDGSAVNVDSVTGAVTGALVVDVDYHVVEANGVYGIVVHIAGSPSDDDQNLTIVYDYTPNASTKLTFNAQGNKTLKAMRIINTDADNKQFKIDITGGTNMEPISLDFAGDDEDDVAILPVRFEGEVVEWVDEQNI